METPKTVYRGCVIQERTKYKVQSAKYEAGSPLTFFVLRTSFFVLFRLSAHVLLMNRLVVVDLTL